MTEPPLVVTDSVIAPEGVPAGVTAENEVALIGVTPVRATPPRVAVSGVLAVTAVGKPEPLIVMTWPPPAGPVAGTTAPLDRVGAVAAR